ncbi:hypothetical protein [Dongia rigui]|uniref:Phosphoribosyltransferase domain-containing protein n=1 Tax=Dongia rigui TaxID=940149 RepID=A0ABU5E0M5_9PROT|nr:hypothetical protein [Dongia rigui]MDY0873100.1 hypothetical protein [Dongia rigui]
MSRPIKVWSLLYYLAEVEGLTWRGVDYTTNKMIKAMKGKPIKGYLNLKVGGQNKTFNQQNVTELVAVMRQEVARKLKSSVADKFCIVPIPNSSAVSSSDDEFRTYADAKAIAAGLGESACAVSSLRWKTALKPAHEGGSRDPSFLFDNLVVMEKPKGPVVLYDDVQTTGSHMVACYRKLEEIGFPPILGIVVGRAIKEQRDPAIGWHDEDVETEEVAFDWDAFFKTEI